MGTSFFKLLFDETKFREITLPFKFKLVKVETLKIKGPIIPSNTCILLIKANQKDRAIPSKKKKIHFIENLERKVCKNVDLFPKFTFFFTWMSLNKDKYVEKR